MITINPVAALAVAAGVNGLLTLAGKDSPTWLKLAAALGVGVAVVGNMRTAIEREEAKELEKISVMVDPPPIIATEPIKSVVSDIDFVKSRMLNWF